LLSFVLHSLACAPCTTVLNSKEQQHSSYHRGLNLKVAPTYYLIAQIYDSLANQEICGNEPLSSISIPLPTSPSLLKKHTWQRIFISYSISSMLRVPFPATSALPISSEAAILRLHSRIFFCVGLATHGSGATVTLWRRCKVLHSILYTCPHSVSMLSRHWRSECGHQLE